MRTLLLIALLLPQAGIAQTRFREAPAGSLPAAAIGGNSMDVRVGDFNADGAPDIVLAKEFSRNRILFNDGRGVFADSSVGRFINATRDSEDIAIADFDGNGWPDVVFAAEDDSTHSLYLNNKGTFTDVSSRLPHFISNAVLAFDVNGDSHPDLLFGNQGQSRILINDGSGTFSDETAARMPVLNDVTQDLLLVDVDRDGDMDLVAGNENGNRLLINNGTGVFADESTSRLPQGVQMETRKIVSGDVNGDGAPDLFVCNMASAAGRDIRDRLYLNDGNGVFSDGTAANLPDELLHTFDAVFADLNGDAAQDLIVAYMEDMPAVFINDGRGRFTDSTAAYLPASAAGNNIGLVLTDLNGDGAPDLYLSRFRQSDALFLGSPAQTGVRPRKWGAQLRVYPQPAGNCLYIETVAGTQQTARVYEAGGREVLCEAIAGGPAAQIDIAALPSGPYLLRLSGDTGTAATRFVVER